MDSTVTQCIDKLDASVKLATEEIVGMADSSPDPAISQRPGTPRWVKAIGIVLLGVVLLALVVLVLGGGQHGPGMHTGTGAVPPPSAAAHARPAHDAAATRRQITVG